MQIFSGMHQHQKTLYRYKYPLSLLVLKEQVRYLFFAYNCMIFEYQNFVSSTHNFDRYE